MWLMSTWSCWVFMPISRAVFGQPLIEHEGPARHMVLASSLNERIVHYAIPAVFVQSDELGERRYSGVRFRSAATRSTGLAAEAGVRADRHVHPPSTSRVC